MRVLRSVFYLLLSVLVLGVAVLYFRSDVEPQRWSPAPLPPLSGELQPRSKNPFASARLTPMPSPGPEDIAIDAAGRLYTGLADGRIVRFDEGSDQIPEVIGHTGGRPLGMQFDRAGNLIVADAVKGLLQLSPSGQIDVLVSEVEGQSLRFVDDLDIAGNGTIWFSDASQRFGYHEYMKDYLEASFTGRLLSYSPSTGQTTVRMEGLFFANGVALGPDEEFVLVNETGTGRIHRLWLKTDRAGQRDLFHDGLPGHPDNLSYNGSDTFWVAMPALRNPAREKSSSNLVLRKLLGGLPESALALPSTAGLVIGLAHDGSVTQVLYQDPAPVSSITSVNQFGDRLYFGSLTAQRAMSVPVPPAR